jgi:hypothetical protein
MDAPYADLIRGCPCTVLSVDRIRHVRAPSMELHAHVRRLPRALPRFLVSVRCGSESRQDLGDQQSDLGPRRSWVIGLCDVKAPLAHGAEEQEGHWAQGLAFEHTCVHGLAQRTS